MIYRYLDCGDLHNGFARVTCKDCGHEYILVHPCKRGFRFVREEPFRMGRTAVPHLIGYKVIEE